MTSIRKSIIFAPEKTFGGGLPAGAHYIHAPPHSFISHTPNRSTNRLNASGTKKYDAIAYGKVSGTWDWSFVLDYDYLEPLALIFECINGHVQNPKSSENFATYASDTTISASTDYVSAMRRSPGYDTETYTLDETYATSSDGYAEAEKEDGVVYKVKVADTENQYTYHCIRKGTETVCGEWNDYVCIVYIYEGMYFSEPIEINGEVKSTTKAAYIFKDEGNNYRYYFLDDGYTLDLTNNRVLLNGEPITRYIAGESGFLYKHTFSKVDWGRVRSFTVRQVILNEMAGGTVDEVLEMRGCVVKSVTFRQAAGSSQIQVSLSGANIWDRMWLGSIARNDYAEHEGQLIEFGCVYIGDANPSTNEPLEANKAGQVDSWNIEISNNVEMVDTTCGARSVNYEEGQSEYNFQLTLYSNNPLALQQRLYTGGQDITNLLPGAEAITVGSATKYYIPEPMCKNLKPLKRADVLSYNTCVKDLGGTEATTLDAYHAATKALHVIVKGIVIKSIGWQRGEGQKLQDSVNAECREITLETIGKVQNWLANPSNYVNKPMGPRWGSLSGSWVTGNDVWTDNWDPAQH